MNHRTVSSLARAFGLSAIAIVIAACAAPVGNESEGTSEEAVRQPCANGNPYTVCPSAGSLGTSALEQGLVDFGCSGKVVIEGGGPGKEATYQTTCPLGVKRTFACGAQHCSYRALDDRLVCTTPTVTGYIQDFVACHKIEAAWNATSACGCNLESNDEAYVFWDPTCSSGSCSTHFLPN